MVNVSKFKAEDFSSIIYCNSCHKRCSDVMTMIEIDFDKVSMICPSCEMILYKMLHEDLIYNEED